jgi:Family of unknown function (DUF6176)
MKVELSRFRVKEGKSARVDEWLQMLNDNMAAIIPMLDQEQMKFEVIFRELIGGVEYLHWFSVQEDSGTSANQNYEVGRKHMEFGEECIDHDYGMRDAQAQVIMAPDVVAQVMLWKNPHASVTPFQQREIVRRRPD